MLPKRTRDWDTHGATFGYCASKKKVYFCYRLHLVVPLGGVILDFELTAADADERDVAAELLPLHAGRTYVGDKGYVDDDLAMRLLQQGVKLIALRRQNQHTQLSKILTRFMARFRAIIEGDTPIICVESWCLVVKYGLCTSTTAKMFRLGHCASPRGSESYV